MYSYVFASQSNLPRLDSPCPLESPRLQLSIQSLYHFDIEGWFFVFEFFLRVDCFCFFLLVLVVLVVACCWFCFVACCCLFCFVVTLLLKLLFWIMTSDESTKLKNTKQQGKESVKEPDALTQW